MKRIVLASLLAVTGNSLSYAQVTPVPRLRGTTEKQNMATVFVATKACEDRAQLLDLIGKTVDGIEGLTLGECQVETVWGRPVTIVGVDSSGRGFFNQVAAVWETESTVEAQMLESFPSEALPIEIRQLGAAPALQVIEPIWFEVAGCSAVEPRYYRFSLNGFVPVMDEEARPALIETLSKLDSSESYIATLLKRDANVDFDETEKNVAMCRLAETIALRNRLGESNAQSVGPLATLVDRKSTNDRLADKTLEVLQMVGSNSVFAELTRIEKGNGSARLQKRAAEMIESSVRRK